MRFDWVNLRAPTIEVHLPAGFSSPVPRSLAFSVKGGSRADGTSSHVRICGNYAVCLGQPREAVSHGIFSAR